MPISYSIDEERGIIIASWVGAVSIGDVAAYWTALMTDETAMALRRSVVDVRQADMNLSAKDFMTLINTIALPALKGRTWTTAIVVARPDQFGVSRQYQAFADLYSRDAIFSDHAEALQWALDQPANKD